MYHVLVPVDIDKPRAAAQVEAVRDLPNASEDVKADVLYVFEEVDMPVDGAGPAYIDELNRNLETLRKLPQTVEMVAEELEESGIETSVHSVTGEPASAILEIAEGFDVDALVLGARQRSPIGKVLFGSVAQAVILESERPITIASG